MRLRWTLRELRGASSRVIPFILSLAIGVAAIVLVAGLGDSLSRTIRMEARPLLGGDVSVRSSLPLPATIDPVADAFPDVARVDTVEFLTMVAATEGSPPKSLLADLKAVDPGWPFYGALTLDPPRPLASLLDPEGVVVEPALLERLHVAVGSPVRLGATTFTIRGVVTSEPGRLPTGLTTGARVFLARSALARAGLGDTGARITRRALFQVPDEARAAALATWLKDHAGTNARVETWSDAQPSTQRSIERTSSFLGLVALLSLVVGGVGIAQSTRAWMARRLDALAVQRCLGVTTGELQQLALLQTAVLALAGSVVGAGLGVASLAAVPSVLDGLLPPEAVHPFQVGAILRGIGLGLGVALLFAARPLAQAARVPPLRVLRRDVEPLPDSVASAVGSTLVLVLGVFVTAWVQGGDWIVAGAFTLGLLVVAGVVAGLAGAMARALAVLAHRVPVWWLRHGLASIGRPGSGVVPAAVSLALGVVVVLTSALVEGRLFAQVADEFPPDAPSAFVLDVQPAQLAAVSQVLTDHGGERVRSAPMVVGRLAAVDGVPVATLAEGRSDDDRWSLTREQRLTWMASLPADNRIIDGAPFSDAVANELSLESRYAESLGAKVGSRLQFDVQGVPIDFTVTSLRTVAWESFNMNFFLVVEPGVLEAAPHTVLVTATLPADQEASVQDLLAADLPGVSFVSVRSVIAQARGILQKLGRGIQAVGGFTALAGVVILASGVAADAARQGRKVALLKTLGTTRLGVVGVFSIEYGLVGLLAGVLGAAGAVGASWLVVTRLMHLSWRLDGPVVLAAVVLTTLASAVVGVVANQRPLRVRPAEVLRGE